MVQWLRVSDQRVMPSFPPSSPNEESTLSPLADDREPAFLRVGVALDRVDSGTRVRRGLTGASTA